MINAVSSLLKVLILGAVVLVVLSAVGRQLFQSHRGSEPVPMTMPRDVPIPRAIPWDKVQDDVRQALRSAHSKAEEYAISELEKWSNELVARIDTDFLPWYFGYWQQQWMGLKASWYWTWDKLWNEKPTMGETMTEHIQEEFANRVLRPQISEMQIERIVQGTVAAYVESLKSSISQIPTKYNISMSEWDKYLEGIALTTRSVEGNRETPLTLKLLTGGTAIGALKASALLIKTMKPLAGKLGAKVAGKGAGSAAAKLAAKTGAKVGAKAGGKFLGPIIGIGILIWDVWDHYKTKAEQQPILRQNLVDFLAEVQKDLLKDSETGIMSIIDSIEAEIVNSMAQVKSLTLSPR